MAPECDGGLSTELWRLGLLFQPFFSGRDTNLDREDAGEQRFNHSLSNGSRHAAEPEYTLYVLYAAVWVPGLG